MHWYIRFSHNLALVSTLDFVNHSHIMAESKLRRSTRTRKTKSEPLFDYSQVIADEEIARLEQEVSGVAQTGDRLSPHNELESPRSRRPSSSKTPRMQYSSTHKSEDLRIIELQRDKLALELELMKLRAQGNHHRDFGADPTTDQTIQKQRKKRTIDWPHEFAPGAPSVVFEKLDMADFVAGYLAMIKTYEPATKEVMLQLLEVLMFKASHYTWTSVRSFYAQVAQQVELCRLEFDDIADIREKATMYFRHSDLRSTTNNNTTTNNASHAGRSTSNTFTSGSEKSSTAKACRQWNYTGTCQCDKATEAYSGHHKCRVCAKEHPMLHCPKRRAPIPEIKDA